MVMAKDQNWKTTFLFRDIKVIFDMFKNNVFDSHSNNNVFYFNDLM